MRASNAIPPGYRRNILNPNYPPSWKKGIYWRLKKGGYDYDDKNKTWGEFMRDTEDKLKKHE